MNERTRTMGPTYLLVILLAILFLLPSSAAGASDYYSAPPAVWAADTFQFSELGFLGCLKAEGVTTKYCFVAHSTDVDSVRVITQLFEPDDPWPATQAPPIYDQIVPAGSLYTSPGLWEPRISLTADLDGVGEVHVTASALAGVRVRIGGGQNCTGDPIQYQTLATEPDIVDRVFGVVGSIDGRQASLWRCVSYFLGLTSGQWSFPNMFG